MCLEADRLFSVSLCYSSRHVILTSLMFYHRYYARRSHEATPKKPVGPSSSTTNTNTNISYRPPSHLTVLSCLFLAGKDEETPRKVKDVVHVGLGRMNKVTDANGQETILPVDPHVRSSLLITMFIFCRLTHLHRSSSLSKGSSPHVTMTSPEYCALI